MVQIKAKTAQNLLQNFLGLLFTKTPYPLLLTSRFGIHTFFMKFPIDVLILDNDMRVQMIEENLQPNQVFFWNPKYNKILELPCGEIQRLNIKLHDKLQLI